MFGMGTGVTSSLEPPPQRGNLQEGGGVFRMLRIPFLLHYLEPNRGVFASFVFRLQASCL